MNEKANMIMLWTNPYLYGRNVNITGDLGILKGVSLRNHDQKLCAWMNSGKCST